MSNLLLVIISTITLYMVIIKWNSSDDKFFRNLGLCFSATTLIISNVSASFEFFTKFFFYENDNGLNLILLLSLIVFMIISFINIMFAVIYSIKVHIGNKKRIINYKRLSVLFIVLAILSCITSLSSGIFILIQYFRL